MLERVHFDKYYVNLIQINENLYPYLPPSLCISMAILPYHSSISI